MLEAPVADGSFFHVEQSNEEKVTAPSLRLGEASFILPCLAALSRGTNHEACILSTVMTTAVKATICGTGEAECEVSMCTRVMETS